jgi:uncharacterized surface protein with fasciclin (FAS1) repeats
MRMIEYGNRRALAAAVAIALGLAACSGGDQAGDQAAETEVSDENLARVIAGNSDLVSASQALGETGLTQVFEGAAAYTFLAPTDEAFDKLGAASADLRSPEQRPAMAAILRDHIVPGYLTPDDIRNAIELADDQSVKMKTMGGHTMTFAADGDAITVTAEDGATARFTGDALRASNGVAIPVDGVLKTADEAQTDTQ